MFASGKTAAVASAANYIEEVFSTYLYTGNGSTQTITNGIDLAGKGGMVWLKARTSGGSSFTNNAIIDTARGANANGYYSIYTNLTDGQFSPTGSSDAVATAVSATGFTVGGNANINYNTQTDVSWTFRKQAKFFDVVTYTGTGSATTIAHSLGSTPGCIIVKNLDAATNWAVYHRSLGGTYITRLNRDWASDTAYENWANTDPTSTVFTVGNGNATNGSGYNYVAYVFAHNAGGFGLTGTDNVISCGSYTGTGSAQTLSLGYEPQWVLIKQSSGANDWNIWDNMRGMVVGGTDAYLQPNTSNAENASGAYDFLSPTATGLIIDPTSNGYNYVNTNGATYIYIAIRRGPMKVPTSGTSVFNPNAYTATGVGNRNFTDVGFSPDWSIFFDRSNSVGNSGKNITRLLGSGNALNTTDTSALQTGFNSYFLSGYNNNGYTFGSSTGGNGQLNGDNGDTKVFWNFGRAPGFFDMVCYTGTGSARTVTHNLGVAPEMMIVKVRDSATDWAVYHSGIGATKRLILNLTDTPYTSATAGWNDTAPTASVFTVGTNVNVNGNGYLYVAYLFATCAGVSKVFSYTGNGSSQTINCGFTGGARWILIKRTDSTGDWYVWDSARGIVSGNDPHLSLNTTAAEVTTDDTIDTDSTGFVVNQVSATNVNVSSATYIGIAIA